MSFEPRVEKLGLNAVCNGQFSVAGIANVLKTNRRAVTRRFLLPQAKRLLQTPISNTKPCTKYIGINPVGFRQRSMALVKNTVKFDWSALRHGQT